jgi:hypothetical protein
MTDQDFIDVAPDWPCAKCGQPFTDSEDVQEVCYKFPDGHKGRAVYHRRCAPDPLRPIHEITEVI